MNLVIYEMSDVRAKLKEASGGVEDLNSFEFDPVDLREITEMTKSVISGGKISVGNKISFISYFLSQCRIIPTYELEAPMACNVTTLGLSSKMNIYFNPIRMAYKGGIQRDDNVFLDTFESVGNVLLHEAQHLLYNHIDTYDHYIKSGYMEEVNIGTDCQINQDPVIMADSVLMDYGITLDSVREITGDQSLEARQSSEYYFESLMRNRPNQPNNGDGQGGSGGQSGDSQGGDGNSQGGDIKGAARRDARASHSVWNNSPKDVDENKVGSVADASSTTQAIIDGVESAMEQGGFSAEELKGRGLVSGDILDAIIDGKSRKTKLPIKHFIQKGVGRIRRGHRRTYSRIHRQQSNNPRVLRGRKEETVKNIHVYYDTSGSVSRTELEWTFKEIAGLAHAVKADLYATPFDAKVYPEATSKVDKNGVYEATPRGFGGTAFQPVFDHLYETNRQALRNNDLIVIFTDGGGERSVDTHGFKNIVWILVGQDRDVLSVQDPIGMIAYLEDDQNYQIHRMSDNR